MATAMTITGDDLLMIPEDGIHRELIGGELRETPMTVRNRFHTRTSTRVCRFLDVWNDASPRAGGSVNVGEAGVRLIQDPETVVGIDVVYMSPEVMSEQTDNSTILEGIPTLAVEIMSPSDSAEDVGDKIDLYLEVGVPLIWIVDPRYRTVTVHRPDAKPVLFNDSQMIDGEPHLPGFRVEVAKLFS